MTDTANLTRLTRDDIHRPSVINPTDYTFIGFLYLPSDGDPMGDALFLQTERKAIRMHMERTGGSYSKHAHGGSCHICGAHCIYRAVFFHAPSNAYIVTGLDCADKLDCGDVDRFRREVKSALEHVAGKRKAMAFLALHGLDNAYAAMLGMQAATLPREESIFLDIVAKLVRYGSLSDAQVNYLHKLVDQIANRARIAAERQAKHDAAKPFPNSETRLTITATIVSIKQPDDYAPFPTVRMLVEHSDGWKAFGSLPGSLSNAKRGDTVEFSATFKPSDRDPKFGFFSRPTKGRIVASAAAPQA